MENSKIKSVLLFLFYFPLTEIMIGILTSISIIIINIDEHIYNKLLLIPIILRIFVILGFSLNSFFNKYSYGKNKKLKYNIFFLKQVNFVYLFSWLLPVCTMLFLFSRWNSINVSINMASFVILLNFFLLLLFYFNLKSYLKNNKKLNILFFVIDIIVLYFNLLVTIVFVSN